MSRFIKISVTGEQLADDAAEWVAVLDTKQGLLFTVTETKMMTQPEAAAHVATLDVAGFKDWRLPSVEELFLLADRARVDPAIDAQFFPDCQSDWYWTGTPWASSPGDYAWGVGFGGGDANWGGQCNGGFVRACRAGQ